MKVASSRNRLGSSNRKPSRPGQDGIDEFAQGAHDIPIVGKDSDDRRSHGAAQAQSFGHEAAGKDQHPSGGHLAQR